MADAARIIALEERCAFLERERDSALEKLEQERAAAKAKAGRGAELVSAHLKRLHRLREAVRTHTGVVLKGDDDLVRWLVVAVQHMGQP